MQVNFAVALRKDNKPQAYDLQPISGGGKCGCKGGCGSCMGYGGCKGAPGKGGSKDGFGKDGSKGGDFDAMMMGKGCKGGKMMGKDKGKDKGEKKGGGGCHRGRDEAEILGECTGVIKSFNSNNGYGFIECQEIKEKYGADIFLHKQQLGSFQVGDTVLFTAYLNSSGKPQGKDLQEPGNESKRQKVGGTDLGPMY